MKGRVPSGKSISGSIKNAMSGGTSNASKKKSWGSVHVCPQCRSTIRLDDIDLKAVTTRIVNCPLCDWSGQLEIEIVERERQ